MKSLFATLVLGSLSYAQGACSANCLVCESATKCNLCEKTYILDTDACAAQCEAAGSACTDGCASDTTCCAATATSCLTCVAATIGDCATCTVGKVPGTADGKPCVDCFAGCSACSDDATENSCCPPYCAICTGKKPAAQTCTACHAEAAVDADGRCPCVNGQSHCTTCATGADLLKCATCETGFSPDATGICVQPTTSSGAKEAMPLLFAAALLFL